MRKHLTKLMALALAFSMTLAMSATVFAANDGAALKDGDANQFLDAPKTVATMPITTGFVVSNSEGDSSLAAGKTIAYPTVDYAYSLAPATITNESVESPAGSKIAVKPGKLKAVTIGGVTPAADATSTAFTIKVGSGDQLALNSKTMNDKGQEIALGKTDITFTAASFDAPGVYRFVLTEDSTTNDANRLAAGVVKSSAVANPHYIDVYVGWQVDPATNAVVTPKTLVINGYTLLSDNVQSLKDTDGDGTPDTDAQKETKESGLEDVPTVDPSTPDDPTDDVLDTSKLTGGIAGVDNADMYYTYNVEVSKTVAGSMGDTEHEFPFTATVENIGNMKYLVKGAISNTTGDSNDTYTAALGLETSYYLKDGDKATIIGLPPFAKVNFKETQDTESEYKVSAKDGANADISVISSAPHADDTTTVKIAAKNVDITAYSATQAVTAYDKTGTVYTAKVAATAAIEKTAVTNTLDSISPTGVVLRFAPYFFIAAAAVLLLVFARRRREDY